MITRGAVAVLAGLAGLTMLLTACATPIAGSARPAEPTDPPAGGLRLSAEQQRQAELFAEVRTWDMCAMHDVDAAAQATGFAPDELMPYRELGICRLVMKEPDGVSEWELQLDVFPVIPAEGGAPLQAGDLTLQQVHDSDDDMRCAYSLPIGPEGDQPWGIELSVSSLAENRAPCDVARDYATALAPRMADPPLRRTGGTRPALGLTASDPCVVAAAMAPALAGDEALEAADVEVSDLEPFACNVIASIGSEPSGEPISGSVAFTMESADEIGGTTVGGFPAAEDQLGSSCEVRFAPSDVELSGDPDLPPGVPAVEVTGRCEQIDELAEAAAGALAPAPGDAPRDDAVLLGDLNPPPTAAAVGAPFDPCAVVSWSDYPSQVRPDEPRDPARMSVGPDDPFAVGCKFNAGGMFSMLVWGMPEGGFSADPAARRGGAAVRFGGRPGVESVGVNESAGEPNCYSAVQLAEGIAAMSTTVAGDPCAVNRAVLEQVAQEVP